MVGKQATLRPNSITTYVYYQAQQYHGRSGDHKPDSQVEAHAAGCPGS